MNKEQLKKAILKSLEGVNTDIVREIIDGDADEDKFETLDEYLDYAAEEMTTDAMLNDLNQNMKYLYKLEAGHVVNETGRDTSLTDAIHRDEQNLPSDVRFDILPKVIDKKCVCIGEAGYGMAGFGETSYFSMYLTYIDEDGNLFTVLEHDFGIDGISIVLNQVVPDEDYYSFLYEREFLPEDYRELFDD